MTRIVRRGMPATARSARGAWLASGAVLLLITSAARATVLYDGAPPDASLPTALCGNGIVEPGEQCDNGPKNGTLSSCCTATCEAEASGTPCLGGAGTCDTTGTCSCGNGVVEPGEQCDDGARNGILEVCCTELCTVKPRADPCADDGDLCTQDMCFGIVDVCAHLEWPSGGCAAPTVPRGASLLLKTWRGRNRAQFKWGKGPAVPLADFGNPASQLSRLCIYYQLGHSSFLVAAASPSVAADGVWTGTSTGWKFRSTTGAPDGISRIALKAATVPLQAKVEVTARRNPAFRLRFPLFEPLIVQFKTSQGKCWEATFVTATKSTATTFKAKSEVLE